MGRTKGPPKTRVFEGTMYYNVHRETGDFIYTDDFEREHGCVNLYYLRKSDSGARTIVNMGYLCKDEDEWMYILDMCHYKPECVNNDELRFDNIKEAMKHAGETRIKYVNKSKRGGRPRLY